MSEKRELTVKYCPPTKHAKAPYKSICKVITGYENAPETHDYYIQMSVDEENPDWTSMGNFLEKVFEDKFENKTFINHCFEQLSKK